MRRRETRNHTRIQSPGIVDEAAMAYACRKVCKICGAHAITPMLMANGKLCYKCPMGHFWYESPKET